MKKEYKSLSTQLSSLTAQHSALQSQINLLLSSYPVYKSEETKEKKVRSKESVSHKQKNDFIEETKEKEKNETNNRLVIQIEESLEKPKYKIFVYSFYQAKKILKKITKIVLQRAILDFRKSKNCSVPIHKCFVCIPVIL